MNTYDLLINSVARTPELTAASFTNETGPRASFAFSTSIAGTFFDDDLTLTNTTSNQTFLSSAVTVNNSNLVFDLPTDLPNGEYTATLAADLIVNGDASLSEDATVDFFILAGDANRDRTVDLTDFGVLRNNFGQSNVVFSQGDFNYDGTVSLLDFGILRNNFGQSLPTPAASVFADDDE